MKKIVFLCIASCGLVLASCGGSSASDNPDVIIEKEDAKDSIAEPIENQKVETLDIEEPKMKEKGKNVKGKRKR